MPIDLKKFRDQVLKRRRSERGEGPENPEGEAEVDEGVVDDKDAVEDEEAVIDKSDSSSESGGEDSCDPDAGSSESASSDRDAASDPESSKSNDLKANQGETALDFERLLMNTRPDPVGELTSEAESVRTTFRVGREAEALFERLSGRTGRSKKQLLRSALRLTCEAWEKRPDAFEHSAKSLEIEGASRNPMAIAPRTREGLNGLRDETGIDRDRLVEIGIRLAQAAFKRQVRRSIIPHRDVLADLDVLYEEAQNVQKKLSGHEMRSAERSPLCDSRDPVERGLQKIIHLLIEMRDAIENEVESGEPMGQCREFP